MDKGLLQTRAIGILLCMLLTTITYSCQSPPSEIEGAWKIESVNPHEGDSASSGHKYAEFMAYGTIYKFENGVFTVVTDNGNTTKTGTFFFDEKSGALSATIKGETVNFTLDKGSSGSNEMILQTEEGLGLVMSPVE